MREPTGAVADLYKAELTIPLAFDLAKEEPLDISAAARHALRDEFHGGAFLERCVRDIRHLLLPEESAEPAPDENVVFLWDGSARAVAGGTAYGNEDAP